MKKTVSTKIIFPPNQALGQNFLFDKNYLRKIVAYCPIDTNTIIIEIGSGYGNLTNFLAETDCQKVVGLEKDPKLYQWLVENNQNNKIVYFQADALKINWPEFCSEYKGNFARNAELSLIIVGNLPYYLTNSLIVDLLFNYRLFSSLVFLVQKEVGQKWVASPRQHSSQYSALSVFINHLAETKLALGVPAQIFIPVPLVDGALIVIKPRISINMTKEKLVSFLHFLKNCFRFRRKTLLNNLYSFAGNYKKEWEKYFVENNYSAKIRPQNLAPTEYWKLFLFWKILVNSSKKA